MSIGISKSANQSVVKKKYWKLLEVYLLGGGFNPSQQKYESNWIISPKFRGENSKNVWVATT